MASLPSSSYNDPGCRRNGSYASLHHQQERVHKSSLVLCPSHNWHHVHVHLDQGVPGDVSHQDKRKEEQRR